MPTKSKKTAKKSGSKLKDLAPRKAVKGGIIKRADPCEGGETRRR